MSVQRVIMVARNGPNQYTDLTNVTGVSTNLSTGGNMVGSTGVPGTTFDDTTVALGASAVFQGTNRDLSGGQAAGTAWTNSGSNAYRMREFRVSAESDQSFTLAIEASTDNTNWVRIKAVASTAVIGGGQYAEIIHLPSWRYARVIVANGATPMTRLRASSTLIA